MNAFHSTPYVVVGAGLIGSALAKHLAESGIETVLIGPTEEMHLSRASCPAASHFGETRITRTLDIDPVWSALSCRSISRYKELEGRTGISFYEACGCLFLGPESKHLDPYLSLIQSAAKQTSTPTEKHSRAVLRNRFGISVPTGFSGLLEYENAGVIHPRRMVRAQQEAFELAGGTRLSEIVSDITLLKQGGIVKTEGGVSIAASHIVLAAGAYTKDFIDSEKVPLRIVPRTLLFVEVGEQQSRALAQLPAIIYRDASKREHYYLVGPREFPDGKYYIKVGTSMLGGEQLIGEPELRDWFNSQGSLTQALELASFFGRLLPGISPLSLSSQACVYTCTPGRKPYIFKESEYLTVATGGNGMAAKSADEIGRIAATLAMAGEWREAYSANSFAPERSNPKRKLKLTA